MYCSSLKKPVYSTVFPDTEAKNKIFRIAEKLSKNDFSEIANIDDEENPKPFLRFTPEAQRLFIKWLSWLQNEKLSNQDDHPVLIEHLAKYRSLMPTLALIFHLIDIADGTEPGPVSLNSAQMAAAWCQYLESHARRIYSLALNAGTRAAAKLANKIQAGNLPNPFKRYDVQRKNWAMLGDKRSAQEAIDCLIESGWILEAEGEGKPGGRPAAPVYHINPKIFL